MARSLDSWHEQAFMAEGRDCTCAVDPATCEAMVWARRRVQDQTGIEAREHGQLEIGDRPREVRQLGADDPWPEGFY